MVARLFGRSLSGIPLRWVLVIPFVLQTVGAVALVGYLSYRSGQQAVEEMANQLLGQTSNRVRDRLDNQIQLQQQAVAVNYQAWQQGGLNLKDSTQLQAYLWQQITLMPSLPSTSFTNGAGEQIAYTNIQSSQVQALLEEVANENLPIGTPLLLKSEPGNPNRRNFFLVDHRGQPKRQIYTSLTNAQQTPWFEYAKTLQQQGWSPIYVFQFAPIVGLSALAPAKDSQGNFQGVFSSAIPLSDINAFLSKLQFSQSGQVFIMEQSGDLVATSTADPPYSTTPSGFPQRLPAAQGQDIKTREIARQLKLQADRLQESSTAEHFSFAVNEQRHFVQLDPYRDGYGLNWFIVTVVPESDFTGAIDTNNAKTAFLSWITLFLATGLGILTSRWITKPILSLSQASRALAQGEWQQSLKEDSPIAELKALTTSFNQTAEQLQRSFDRTKLALYESQDQFAKIFRTSPDLINIVSLHDGTYVEVNDQFVQVTGYSRDEVIGHQVLNLNLLADPEQAVQLEKLLQTGEPIRNVEVKLRTKTGQVRTGLMSSELIDLEGQRCVLSVFKDVSDRKHAEEALRRSEMALQEAQRVAHLGSWEYDLTTGTTFWSKELYRIHQRDPNHLPPSVEEFVNQLHPHDRLYYQAFGEQLLQGRSVEQDFRIRLQDGSLRHLAVKGEPILNAQGEVIRLVGTALDVTDRKQLELALEASRVQLNNVLNSAIAGITRMIVFPDCSYQVQHISAGVELVSGYTPEELMNHPNLWDSCLLPDDWQKIEFQVFEDIFAERSGTYEYRFLHKDGTHRWLSQSNSSQWDMTRNCWVVTAVTIDISDRKQAEQALRDSEARFQKVTAAAPGEIYILVQHPDSSYEFEYMSPACRDIQELDPLEVMQYPHLSFDQVHPEDRAEMYARASESAATLQPLSHEWRIQTRSGRLKWVRVSARPERRDNGDVVWYGVLQDVSDRKQIEAALRVREEHFQKLATASPGVIYTVVEYPDGPVCYEYLSPAFEEIHEIALTDALQHPTLPMQQMHPDDRLPYQQAMAQSLTEMQPFKHEWRIITPSGKTKWLQANSRPEQRENGEIAWHGVVIEVTEQKQAEADLQRALQQIDNHFENSPLAIVQWDRDFQVLRWSKQAERIFGWKAEAVLHRSWRDWNWVYEADVEFVNTSIAPLLEGTTSSISIQNRNYTKDGRVITCQWYTSAVFDDSGHVASILSFAQDISDRLQAELDLTKAHDLREAIFNEATDAIFLVAPPPQSLILDCNQRAVEMFEVASKKDLIGIEGNTLQKTQFTPAELAEIGAELMAKGYWSREIEYVTKQGRLFWGSLAAKPIQVGDQTMQLVRLTDISDRHELDRIKDEFISIVSHELRTPLTAIRGSLGLLESGILSEEPDTAHHMLKVAVRNSDRLVRLVNDILDLERLESGKVQLVMEPYQVSDLMEMALEGVQALAIEADVTLHHTSLDIQVEVAPDAIVQTLINLLGNAIKFSSPGSMVWLQAKVQKADKWVNEETGNSSPPPSLLFTIKDQGRGIPADKLDNIFGRFQQVDVSDARQKGGTGLGLAICKSIVQQHGGRIWAESDVGAGSTFYFTLPLGVSNQTHREYDETNSGGR